LLALTKEGPKGVMKRIEASLALADETIKGDVMLYIDVIDQAGYAGQVARGDFKKAMYCALCKAFLKAQRNFVVEFVSKLTPEALAELEGIEVSAGERKPPPPLPPQKSAQEQLEDQVREDWKRLSTDKLKVRLTRDAAYKATFDRLMDANQLESQCTTLTDGSRGLQ
jgi:hypothetical protein